jgi:hypothetical protein
MVCLRVVILSLACLVTRSNVSPVAAAGPIDLIRVPNGGIQPEAVVDSAGNVHLVYLAGELRAADVFYTRSADGGRTFSTPVRVNSQEGSAIPGGAIRGAQIAVAPSGRVHVAWNGSDKALPKPPVNPKTKIAGMPMLYARSDPRGASFEPQRNLMTETTDLDGGGTIAADSRGVYVAWHANTADGEGGEAARRVWVARSADDGATFERERPVSDPATGVCGCCALRLFAAPGGELHLLYRSATNMTHRDIYSLTSRDQGRTFQSGRVHEWEIGACPMTSMSVSAAGQAVLRAWETDGQVYFDSTGAKHGPIAPPVSDSQTSARRKYPRLAASRDGTVLLAWTDITSRTAPGTLAWQAFDANGRPTPLKGAQPGVPASSFGAVIARPDGGFTIVY